MKDRVDTSVSEEDKETWQYIEYLITTLGKDGMSSDESDIEEGSYNPHLVTKKMTWRRDISTELGIIDKQLKADKELKPRANKGLVRTRPFHAPPIHSPASYRASRGFL